MKQPTDNDVQFRVDLGRVHNGVFKVELQQCAIENKFLNFYDTQKGDFRDLTFTYGGFDYPVTVDRYLTIDNLSNFIANKTGVDFEISMTSNIGGDANNLRVTLKGILNYQIIFKGYGWSKLGFENVGYSSSPQTFTGGSGGYGVIQADYLPDFGQPPMILLRVQQFDAHQNAIQNRLGIQSFSIPSQSVNFADRILWVNTNAESNQYIKFQQPISLQYLDVSLLSCDQKLLTTPSNKQGVPNQQDLEIILVLSLHCYE